MIFTTFRRAASIQLLPLCIFILSSLPAWGGCELDGDYTSISLMAPTSVGQNSGNVFSHLVEGDGSHTITMGGWDQSIVKFRYDIPYKDLSSADCLELTFTMTNIIGALSSSPLSLWYFDNDWDISSNVAVLDTVSAAGSAVPVTVRIPMTAVTNDQVDPSKLKDFFIRMSGSQAISATFHITDMRALAPILPPPPPPNLDADTDPSIGKIQLGTLSILEATIDYPIVHPEDGENPALWSIVAENSPLPIQPGDVGRFTVTRTVVDPKGESLDASDILLRHTYYLSLPETLHVGTRYHITYSHPTDGNISWSIVPGQDNGASQAIKINQFGYNAAATERYAYVGYWMGSLGTLPLPEPLHFRVVTPDGMMALDDLSHPIGIDTDSGEYVHQLDISALLPGDYALEVDSIGVSRWFRVGNTAFEAYYHTLRGLYHERCGMALEAAYTLWTRGTCHTEAYRNDALEDYSLDFPSDTPKTSAVAVSGGWHDAGDFDRRPVHLITAAHLLILSDMFPTQLANAPVNLPESGNGYSDALNEALWGLSFWLNNQRDDGGVRSGSQSTGHPAAVTADHDLLPYWIYAPNRATSYFFAGAAAHAAHLLEKIGTPSSHTDATRYKQAALNAWAWAEAQTEIGTTSIVNSAAYTAEQKQIDINRLRFYAAGQLLALTHNAAYGSIGQSLWTDLKGPTNWDTVFSLWGYLQTDAAHIGAAFQLDIRNRLLASADQFIAYNAQNAYRHARQPNYSISWGTGTNPVKYLTPAIMAYAISPNQTYINAVSINVDFQLGAHPTGISWMTGMGYAPPEAPLQNDSRYDTRVEPVPGLPINGPFESPYETCTPMTYWKCWVYASFYPAATPNPLINGVPRFRHYSPWDGMAPMNEFTVWTDMGYTSLAYGFLYAVSQEAPRNLSGLTLSDFPRNPVTMKSESETAELPPVPPGSEATETPIAVGPETVQEKPDKSPVVNNGSNAQESPSGTNSGAPLSSPTSSSASAGGCSLRR